MSDYEKRLRLPKTFLAILSLKLSPTKQLESFGRGSRSFDELYRDFGISTVSADFCDFVCENSFALYFTYVIELLEECLDLGALLLVLARSG